MPLIVMGVNQEFVTTTLLKADVRLKTPRSLCGVDEERGAEDAAWPAARCLLCLSSSECHS